ncbi:MAG: GTP-binding protein [Asgard group archaeon]|nr:GTP-binding protein [Asgard group archaeon]
MIRKVKLIAKVVLAGEGGVGKTTLLHRYLENKFLDSTKITIGADFYSKDIFLDEHSVKVQIWDLGGQEQFKQMGIFKNYFRGTNVTVVMFDLTRLITLDSVPEWADLALSNSDTKLMLVGGKKDLAGGITFTEDDFTELFEKYDFKSYHETSSATGEGVGDVFDKIGKIVIDTHIEKKTI